MFIKHELSEVESTNDWLKRGIDNEHLPDNYLIYTTNQTRGRGQFTRIWQMDPGLDLAFSFYRREESRLNFYSPALYTMTICLSLKDTFDFFGIDAAIKWPNDLLVLHRKIAGILIESLWQQHYIHIITGIGVNLNSNRLEKRDPFTSISLKDVLGKPVEYRFFLEKFEYFFTQISKKYFSGNSQFILNTYNGHLYKRGQVTELIETKSQKPLKVRIVGVDDGGRLITEQGRDIIKYHNGEVKYKF